MKIQDQEEDVRLKLERIDSLDQLTCTEGMTILSISRTFDESQGIIITLFDGKADVERELVIIGDAYLSEAIG